jgi:hypothetical protein
LAGQVADDVERAVQALAVDHIEAEELLLGLGERAVEHQRLAAVLRRVVAAVVGIRRATGPRRPSARQASPRPPSGAA